MRRLVWWLMPMAALALVGCGNGSDASSSAAPGAAASAGAPAAPSAVTGTVTLLDPTVQVSAAAKLQLALVDVSVPTPAPPPLAAKTIEPVGAFPLAFTLNFNPADVHAGGIYELQVDLIDGERQYMPKLHIPVSLQTAVPPLSVQLAAQPTPGEAALAAFAAVKAQIGGMNISNGTKLDTNASRGWQVFREGGQVKFIRERADYGDKGFTSTDMAFKDGKPWVVEQQKKASRDAKQTSTLRVAWSDGALVLKTSTDDAGKTTPLSDEDVAGLQKEAMAMLALATGGKGT